MKDDGIILLTEQFDAIKDQILANNSVDCVIFGYEENQIKVLISKWKGKELYGLPGGFVFLEEDLDKAAERVLFERTGLVDSYLAQFYTFGTSNRRSEAEIDDLKKLLGNVENGIIQWYKSRFITTGYLSFASIKNSVIYPDLLSENCKWHSVYELPNLVFDHKKIIEKALEIIRAKTHDLPVGKSLLPAKFTMGELQKLHESVLNKKLDRGNFQRKFLNMQTLTRHEKQMTGGAHKAPYLYSFVIN